MKPYCLATSIAIFLGCLLTVVLVPLSLHRISYDEVAVRYDLVSRTLGSEILREGLHDVGPSGSLLVLKTTQRDAEFKKFSVLTKDSLSVFVDIVVVYAIVVADIFAIFDEYGAQEEHDDYIANLCAQRITDVSVQFNASQYFLERQAYQMALQNSISELFTQQDSHVTLYFAQVVNIDLPSAATSALLATTVAIQDVQSASGERAKDVQAAQISYDLAASNANLTLLAGQLAASQIDQQAEQERQAIKSKLELRTYTFSNISSGLGNGGAFFVDSYLKPLVLSTHTGGKTLINL